MPNSEVPPSLAARCPQTRHRVHCSIVFSVLESYQVVRDQLTYMQAILPENWEVVIVDDGSKPSIFEELCKDEFLAHVKIPHIQIMETRDFSPWTQACGFNYGAFWARGDYLLMMAIDHFISTLMIEPINTFTGDKMVFPRLWGVLSDDGEVLTDRETLSDYGLPEKATDGTGAGAGIFLIKKTIWDLLGGYDERHCGKYGNDDVDINKRYAELHRQGKAQRAVVGPPMYVYPNPRADVKQIFHGLRRKKAPPE